MPKRKNPESLLNQPDIGLEPGRHTPTPETMDRTIEVARKISDGWSRFETKEWIKKTWGVKDQSASRYWNGALAYLAVNASDSEYVEEMRQKTIATLDKLIQKEIQERRYKEANASMELQSKIIGYSTQKIEAKVDGEIKFTFGE